MNPLVLRDRYQALEVIGQGGQGSVVRALDQVHNRVVAVKIRTCRPAVDRSDLLGEAGILLRVRPHPLLPLVREDFFDGDRYCVVMDFVDGTDLQQQLAQRGGPGLPLDEVVEALGQVAKALDHLHGHDPPVVHGDVKPANIVRTADGRAVLVDFGIATRGAHPDPVQAIYGTAGYTAPEVARGAAPSVAADVFSLAATAFALLTGSPPSPGRRPEWAEIAGDRAGAVEATLRQGLAFDPARRPPRAGGLVDGLRGRLRVATNLPLEPTPFVGRAEELATVGSLLKSERLVTVVGTGGVGKSRLAREAARKALDEHPDGVHLVELAPLVDANRVADEVRTTLGLTANPVQPASEALVDHLAARRLLLVVDNCEHVVGACAELLGRLLAHCPHLRVLATSREPLRIPGEVTWRLPSMSDGDAVALFVARAKAAHPAFVGEGHKHPVLVRICQRLDGIPLALELAAARMSSLSLDELDRCLDDRLSLLTTGARTAPPRHQTLRATIDWTYEDLSENERRLFRRLSVFAGGFTLEAALEVVADGGVSRAMLAELLGGLVDKSLVLAEGIVAPDRRDGATRYGLLEALRQYAREALEASAEAPTITERHLAWARSLAQRADAGLEGPEQAHWLHVLEGEHDNLRAALAVTPDLALAAALGRFWERRGHWGEGRRWLARALDAEASVDGDGAGVAADEASIRSSALHGAGVLAMRQGDYEAARILHEESLAMRRRLADRTGEASSLLALANLSTSQGDHPGAAATYARSMDLGREVGDQRVVAAAAANLGWLAAMRWDASAATELLEQSLDLRRDLGDLHGVASVLTLLGHVRRNRGQYAAARALHEESLPVQRELGDRYGMAWTLTHLGLVHQWQGDAAAAGPLHEEALAIRRDIGDRSGASWSLLHLSDVCRERGDLATAAELLDESLASARALNDPWCINKALTCGARLARAMGDLDAATIRLEEALAIAVRQRFELAVAACLQELGGVAADRGAFVDAARLLGAADARRRAVHGVVHPGERQRHAQDAAAAEHALGGPAYAATFAEGASMPLEELVSQVGDGEADAGKAT